MMARRVDFLLVSTGQEVLDAENAVARALTALLPSGTPC
jgi:hypothetical protein